MAFHSVLRSVVRYFQNGRLRRKVRPAPMRLESLENREVLTATIGPVSPADMAMLSTNTTSLVVTYTEDVNGANDANNYVLLDSHGHEIPLDNPVYAPAGGGQFTATFDAAAINDGKPLPIDTYTLFVRGDRITDASDGKALAQPNRLIVTSGPRRTVSAVDLANGTVGAISNYPVAPNGSTAANPYAVASGDLNKDGQDDLVLVNGGTDTVNVYLGRSAQQGGGFATAPDLTLLLPTGGASQIKDVIVRDFDNDNKPDIAVLNNASDTVSFFRNTGQVSGSLSFASPQNLTGLQDARDLDAGDFDKDGFADLVVANRTAFGTNYQVTVFLNDQNGGFLAGQRVTVGTTAGTGVQNPVAVAVGDFDNDGDADIAAAGNNLAVLRNTTTQAGSPSFTLVTPNASPTNFNSLTALNVDANTIPDLVGVSTTGDVVSLLSLGDGTFRESPYTITASTAGKLASGDLNGDGRPEVFVTGGPNSTDLSVLATTAKFGAIKAVSSANPIVITSIGHGLTSGDKVVITGVNGVPNANGGPFQITVLDANRFSLQGRSGVGQTYVSGGTWGLAGDVSAAPTPAANAPVILTPAKDYHLQDGARITVSGVGTVANGTYVIDVLPPLTAGAPPRYLLVGSTGTGAQYTPGGTFFVAGSLGAFPPVTVGAEPTGVTTLDANGDGDLDVVTANRTGNSFSVLLGSGDQHFVTPVANALTTANTGAVAYGDLNRDGIRDIVAVSNNAANASSKVSVLLGNADGTFKAAVDYAPTNGTTFALLSNVTLADTDGDGDLDIVVTGEGSNGSSIDGVAILRNATTPATNTLSASSFTAGAVIPTGESPTDVVAGDFNGDGRTDLAVAHNAAGGNSTSTRRGVTILLGTGGGAFNSQGEVGATQGFAASGIAAFDYNRDGKTDLAVVEDATPGRVIVLKGDNSGSFTSAGLFDTGLSRGTAIATGDFDNDGYADIAVASASTGVSSGGVSVLLNDAGTGFEDGVQTDVAPGTALADLAVSDVNLDGRLDVVVSALSGTADNVYFLAGKGDGTFFAATPYLTGDNGATAVPASHIALGNSPLLRLTTFTTGGKVVQPNLVANGDFEGKDLNGEKGTLTGWKTFDLDNGFGAGSAGGFGIQGGTTSPLSGSAVSRPTGDFQAVLDEPDLLPVPPGQANPNDAASYAGTHALYQDVFIPANATSVLLSLQLYLRSDAPWTDTDGNPPLSHTPLSTPNQQVRIDLVRPNGDVLSVAPGDVLTNLFRTDDSDIDLTRTVTLQDFDVSAFAGQTVRLRIAATNNQGKLIVGVDDVELRATFNDTIAPTISGVRLRTPATNTGGVPMTTDPTILGKVGDNGGIDNIARIEFDPDNKGFVNNTFKIDQIDPSGNFTFTFPRLSFGRHTVGIRVIDKAGNATTTTFTFEYQTLFTNDWQSVGPTEIKVGDPTLGYEGVWGRVTSIAVDATDESGNTYYLGSANGGVWKTTNGGGSWTPLTNDVVSGGVRVSGAIGAIAVSPRTPNTVYAGLGVADLLPDSQAGSGILKSTNGGATWTVVGNSATVFAGARITKIVVGEGLNPSGPDSIYVAVAAGAQFGASVYRSNDGGNTWENILTGPTMGLPTGTLLSSVTDLVIDPFNKNRLLIGMGDVGLLGTPGATGGVWETNDATAQFPAWTPVTGGDNTSLNNNTLPAGSGLGNVKVALGNGKPGDERFIYVLIGTPPGSNAPPAVSLGGYNGLYRSSDDGLNFTKVQLKQDTDPTAGQNFQDINLGNETTVAAALVVDPSNPNVVYVGGSRKLDQANPLTHALIRVDTGNILDASRANSTGTVTNTGSDFTKDQAGAGNEGVFFYDIEQQASNGAGVARLLPPAITALRFDPQGRLLIGTDGGIWSGTSLGFGYDFSTGGTGDIRSAPATRGGMRLSAISSNLQITAVTSSAVDPTVDPRNGGTRTYVTTLGSGQAVTDGPNNFVSQDLQRSFPNGTFDAGVIRSASPTPGQPTDPTTLYRVWKYDSSGNLRPERSVDNGETWTELTNGISTNGSTAAYFPALAVNPNKIRNGAQFFDEVAFGTNRLFYSRTSGNSFASSQVFNPNAHVTAIGIAQSPTGFYYAGLDNGEVWVGGGTFTKRVSGLPTGLPVTSIAVSAANQNIAFVTFGGGDTTTPRVYRTANAGQSWLSVSANLPKQAVNAVVYDSRPGLGAPSGKVYVGTDSGVFVLPVGRSAWTRVGTLPTGKVVDLSLDQTTNVLSASVQGRGVFQLAVGGISPIADQVVSEDAPIGPIKFTLNDLGLAGTAISVSGVSSNQAVVRNGGIVISGSGNTRTVTLTPVREASGTTTITLRASDGTRVLTTSFKVTVNVVNDAPTISPIVDQSIQENGTTGDLPFKISDPETPNGPFTVTATSDNQTLVPDGNIVLNNNNPNTGPNQTIRVTPAVNQTGTARITITVTDPDGASSVRSFDVVVQDSAVGLPFTDSFDRGDNSFLGSAWTDQVGDFRVQGNAATNAVKLSLSTLNGVSESDVAVQAAIDLPARSGQFAGLVARYQGTGDRNLYLAGISAAAGGGYSASIFVNVNGTYTLLKSVPVASGTGTMRFEVVDTSLKLFLNGQLQAYAFDSRITQAGSVGIRANGAVGIRFDDFAADTASPTNPSVPFTDDFSAPVNGQLSRDWVERSGNFRLNGSNAANAATAGASIALLGPDFVSYPDVLVTADLTTSANGQFAGLMARANAAGTTYYQAGLLRNGGTTMLNVYRVVNGAATLIGSQAAGATSGKLSFTVSGTTLSVTLAGGASYSITDTGILDPGTVGMRAVGPVTFDNFTFSGV